MLLFNVKTEFSYLKFPMPKNLDKMTKSEGILKIKVQFITFVQAKVVSGCPA